MNKNIENKIKNETQKKYRLLYWYVGRENVIYTIPVGSIFEAALVKHSLAYTDLIKYDLGVTGDYMSSISLEVFEGGCWVDWYDDYSGNDSLEDWLEENEPENYNRITNLHKHFRAIRKNGEDLTLDYDNEEEC